MKRELQIDDIVRITMGVSTEIGKVVDKRRGAITVFFKQTGSVAVVDPKFCGLVKSGGHLMDVVRTIVLPDGDEYPFEKKEVPMSKINIVRCGRIYAEFCPVGGYPYGLFEITDTQELKAIREYIKE